MRNHIVRAASVVALFGLGLIARGEQPDKLPVPPPQACEKCRKELREIFSADYEKATNPAAKQQLAQKLLDQGAGAKDAAEQYALLDEARGLALDAGDDALAARALDLVAARYQVDALALTADLIAQMSTRHRGSEAKRSQAKRVLPVVEEAILADRFDVAHRLVGIALSAARAIRDKALINEVTAAAKELDRVERTYKKLAAERKTLEQSPADPAANLAVGKYHCFVKSDWEQGLPILLLGNDPALGPLAARELKNPKAPDELLSLADDWLAFGEKEPAPTRRPIRQHAASMYRKALPELNGLARARAIKVLDKIDDSSIIALLNRSNPLYFDEFDNPASGFPAYVRDWPSTGKKAGRYGCGYESGKWFVFVDRNDATTNLFSLMSEKSPWVLQSAFACEVVGRATAPAVTWALDFENEVKHKSLQIAVHDDQTFDIAPYFDHEGPRLARTNFPGLSAGTEFNTMLVVMTPRSAWLTLNGIQVGDAIALSDDFFPVSVRLRPSDGVSRNGVTVRRAEIERIRIWDQTALPARFLP